MTLEERIDNLEKEIPRIKEDIDQVRKLVVDGNHTSANMSMAVTRIEKGLKEVLIILKGDDLDFNKGLIKRFVVVEEFMKELKKKWWQVIGGAFVITLLATLGYYLIRGLMSVWTIAQGLK